MTDRNWTAARVEQLKSLWGEGLSASQVAYALGGVSRNAVIGKVHRLGLKGRANARTISRPRLPSAPKLSTTSRLLAIVPVVEEEPIKLEDGCFATVLTISNRMCRWPIGDPRHGDFHFCGRSPKSGSAYCEAHDQRAHQSHQPKDGYREARSHHAGGGW
jgi:GcrA cell cycle regulator